ncbi:hypothetical protein [Prevotella sp. OH937_COT-195]|nr:hypothetical protein [Prevotella sp. OH937_COT-195]
MTQLETESGAVASHKTDLVASIDLPIGVSTFHSNPSGEPL